MDEKEQKKISKFLSLILRHKPEAVGITLDPQGWASTAELLTKAHYKGLPLTMGQLREVVENNDKKRFVLSRDEGKIRASQGHSIPVDLGLVEQEPPQVLYHGTAASNLRSIREQGINKKSRQHVHLSGDVPTAMKVGGRHGKPVVLEVNSLDMHRQGKKFYLSENGVWLTDEIPPEFINFPS